MITPTCPTCHRPQEARAAIANQYGMLILVSCGEHNQIIWQPKNRFIQPSFWQRLRRNLALLTGLTFTVAPAIIVSLA